MSEIIVTSNPNILDPRQMSFDERAKQIEEEEKQRQKQKKDNHYKEWVQLNIEEKVLTALTELSDEPIAMKIFLFLIKHMDNYNAIMASNKVMMEALSLSQSSISRGIKTLSNKGFIYIMKSGTSNVYVLNNNVVWKSWGENMAYCEFPANVVLSQSEQQNIKVRNKKIRSVETAMKETP